MYINVNAAAVAIAKSIYAGPIEQQIDLARVAESLDINFVDSVAIAAFEQAEALLRESETRGHNG